MYKLQFKENNSKYFPEALEFAKELGGTFNNGIVTIEIENVLEAYAQIRQLFSFIQNWKSTQATYNGKEVHPYQFLLHAHWIGDCYDLRTIDKDCGDGWQCMKIDNLRYHIKGKYYPSRTYWYNYGHFKGYKWIIDKEKIFKVLLNYAESKAINLCPFFNETKLQSAVRNLPDYLIPDNVTFEIVYNEAYKQGQQVVIPCNIRHLFTVKDKMFNLEA